jgi:hypothetical protein
MTVETYAIISPIIGSLQVMETTVKAARAKVSPTKKTTRYDILHTILVKILPVPKIINKSI